MVERRDVSVLVYKEREEANSRKEIIVHKMRAFFAKKRRERETRLMYQHCVTPKA